MSLFRLDSSIRGEGSVSREVADTVERAYVEQHPHATVVRRDLGRQPVPPTPGPPPPWPGSPPRTSAPTSSGRPAALAAELADELLAPTRRHRGAALQLRRSAPPQGVDRPAHHRPRASRPAPGRWRVARSRSSSPAAVGYGAGTPREGWDHATPYLLRILGDLWGAEVTLVAAELTLADTVPAMAELRPAAAESKAQAHELAEATGKALARTAA
jgi:FMN-dependent NADH-azoreductase